MALQIRVSIDDVTKFIDLYDDEPVLISLGFAELEDITKKNSAFSKAFGVPGSKNNNQIFNYFYDLNSVPLDFNPNNKFNCIMMWDGYEILNGYIRLNSVSLTQDDIVYQITFYNQVGDLAANIGDKFLYDLDYTSINHPFSPEVITESQVDPNLFPLTGATNYSYQNGKVMWGLYNIGYEYISGNSINTISSSLVQFSSSSGGTYIPQYGYFDNSATPVRDYYFKPSIQIKTMYELIAEQNGYEIISEFFNTSYFEKFYMPLKFLDETIYDNNAVSVCFKYENAFIYTPNSVNTYTNPLSGVTCNNYNFPLTSTGFTIATTYIGQYTIRASFNPKSTGGGSCGITATNNDCLQDFVVGYYDIGGNFLVETIPSSECGVPRFIGNSCCPQIISGVGVAYETSQSSISLWFTDGTQNINLSTVSVCGGQTSPVTVDTLYNVSGNSTISFYFTAIDARVEDFKVDIIKSPRFLISGSTIDYKLEFPTNDYKQIDFLTSINRYFNLVMVPSPNEPGKIIVEPIIDYVGKGEILDWTRKIDYLNPVTISPVTELVNGTLEFSFKLDQDYANQNFNSAANRVFGSDKFKLGLEYKDNVTNFTFLFSSPIDITINAANYQDITLSSFSKIQSQDTGGVNIQQFLPFKILPRLVYRGVTMPNDNYGFVGGSATTYQNWYLWSVGQNYNQDRFQEINRFTTYPFFYSGFSHYLNFRGEDIPTVQPAGYTFVAEDLYDIYYKNYIEDLISPECKLFKGKIYLYPNEIKNLRFDEKILINNSYFRINKINNYNLLEPALCDIELIKLNKDYVPHRKLYYKMQACSGGTSYYSNSDLNYNLYAYAGKQVKLYNDNLSYLGCKKVTVVPYQSGVTYSHYYLSNEFPTSLVGVYDDCGCTTRTPFDIVQQTVVPPSPTPAVTSTPTPTPTHTPYYYVVEPCSGGTQYTILGDVTPLIGQVYRLNKPDCVPTMDGNNCWLVQGIVSYGLECTGVVFGPNLGSCVSCLITPTPSITPSNTPTIAVTPTPTQTLPLYYKLDACISSPSIYTTVVPLIANQRYYDFDNDIYYVWDNTTTTSPSSIVTIAIQYGDSGCPA